MTFMSCSKPIRHRRTAEQERFTIKMRSFGRDPMPLRLQTTDPAKAKLAAALAIASRPRPK